MLLQQKLFLVYYLHILVLCFFCKVHHRVYFCLVWPHPAAFNRHIINYNQLYGRCSIMHVVGRLFVRTLAINQLSSIVTRNAENAWKCATKRSLIPPTPMDNFSCPISQMKHSASKRATKINSFRTSNKLVMEVG